MRRRRERHAVARGLPAGELLAPDERVERVVVGEADPDREPQRDRAGDDREGRPDAHRRHAIRSGSRGRGRLSWPVSAGPSLYRRHRPRTFAEVVGQQHVVRTLTNAVERDRVHHAYLFVGSRGTGKTSMAKILAACLNCVRRADRDAVRRLRVVRLDRRRELARRDRDGRRVVELGRRHPRAARVGRLRAGLRTPEGLHPRRGAHALDGGLERVPQDARGAAAEHRLRARDDRGPEGAADRRRPLPPLRLPAPDRRADRDGASSASRAPSRSRSAPEAVAVLARHAAGSFRDALGTLEQLQTYAGAEIALADVLAVLGISDAELLFRALDAVAAERSARARSARSPRRVDGGRDPAAFIRELEAHARELLIVQMQGGDGAGRAAADARPRRAARRAGGGAARPPRWCGRSTCSPTALTHLKAGADAAHAARARADPRRAAGPRPDASRRSRPRVERARGGASGAPRRAPAGRAPPWRSSRTSRRPCAAAEAAPTAAAPSEPPAPEAPPAPDGARRRPSWRSRRRRRRSPRRRSPTAPSGRASGR